MGRSRRNRSYKISTTTELDYMRIIKIGIGVLLIFGLVYLGTAIGMGEIKLDEKKQEQVENGIQYEEIIGGNTFSRTDKEYYVLFYDFKDQYGSYYKSLIQSYKAQDNSLAVYLVDLNKKINEAYIAGENDTVKKPTRNSWLFYGLKLKSFSNLASSKPKFIFISLLADLILSLSSR